MNRSFLCGIIISSLTWGISLYLYWTLLNNSDPSATMVPIQSKPSSNSNNKLSDKSNKNYGYSANTNLFMDKMQRYKKEQKFRKISQKLIDDLQPIKTANIGKNQDFSAKFYLKLKIKKNIFR